MDEFRNFCKLKIDVCFESLTRRRDHGNARNGHVNFSHICFRIISKARASFHSDHNSSLISFHFFSPSARDDGNQQPLFDYFFRAVFNIIRFWVLLKVEECYNSLQARLHEHTHGDTENENTYICLLN